MTIYQSGSLNPAAQVVPDLDVVIVPPSTAVINGLPTNRGAYVGTASWGPANTVVGSGGNYGQLSLTYGPVVARKYDMMTHAAIATINGASDFRCVRVTDGTDMAASGTITGSMTYTSKYTGSYGNNTLVYHQAGAKTGTVRVIVSLGALTETYDNIGFGLTGNPLLVAIAAAINSGAGTLRGPSAIVIASAGTGTTAPGTPATPLALTGGTDGAGVTAVQMIGIDGALRSGMYALRSSGASMLDLCDNDTASTWTTMIAFAQSEGMIAVVAGPSADTIATAVSTKASAGVDDPWIYVLFGDYLYWADPTNGVTRAVAPSAFMMGRLQNSSPQISPLNKTIYGIAGSQRLGAPGSAGLSNNYSQSDLAQLAQAGIDVITTPSVGGTYWSSRIGRNASSDVTRRLVSYTRLTNFIAATLNGGMGIYVGQLISPVLLMNVTATLSSFMRNLLNQSILVPLLTGADPFTVVCNVGNNPSTSTDLDIVRADVTVKYPGINEEFIVNLQGGPTVTIASSAVQIAN